MDAQFVPVILAALSIIGVYLKHQHSDQVAFRRDLFKQYTGVTCRLEALTGELDVWRNKYLGLADEHLNLRTRYLLIGAQLSDIGQNNQTLQGKYDDIQKMLDQISKEHMEIQLQCQAMGIQLEDIKTRYLPKEEWDKYKFGEEDEVK